MEQVLSMKYKFMLSFQHWHETQISSAFCTWLLRLWLIIIIIIPLWGNLAKHSIRALVLLFLSNSPSLALQDTWSICWPVFLMERWWIHMPYIFKRMQRRIVLLPIVKECTGFEIWTWVGFEEPCVFFNKIAVALDHFCSCINICKSSRAKNWIPLFSSVCLLYSIVYPMPFSIPCTKVCSIDLIEDI